MHYSRLRDLREDSDLTQEQLVKELGMHKTTYTNYEQGKREIPFGLVVRLAQFYNISCDYIAGLVSEPHPIYPNLPCRWDPARRLTSRRGRTNGTEFPIGSRGRG